MPLTLPGLRSPSQGPVAKAASFLWPQRQNLPAQINRCECTSEDLNWTFPVEIFAAKEAEAGCRVSHYNFLSYYSEIQVGLSRVSRSGNTFGRTVL